MSDFESDFEAEFESDFDFDFDPNLTPNQTPNQFGIVPEPVTAEQWPTRGHPKTA